MRRINWNALLAMNAEEQQEAVADIVQALVQDGVTQDDLDQLQDLVDQIRALAAQHAHPN